MGKKRYKEKDVSKPMTKDLGIADLLVLKTSTDSHYYTVHERYFSDDKLVCPACGSTKTRCSKVVKRTFKDILWDDTPAEEGEEQGFRVFDLTFYQTYLRCDGCNNSVFPEPIEFGDKGCRYTNRLADALADGTFRFSYKKVCDYFGVLHRPLQSVQSCVGEFSTENRYCSPSVRQRSSASWSQSFTARHILLSLPCGMMACIA